MTKQIERITEYENRFAKAEACIRALEGALADWIAAETDIRALEAYYTSGQWRNDYEDDEAGRLPEDLKRGVLSQDGIYNLLTENDELKRRIKDVLS